MRAVPRKTVSLRVAACLSWLAVACALAPVAFADGPARFHVADSRLRAPTAPHAGRFAIDARLSHPGSATDPQRQFVVKAALQAQGTGCGALDALFANGFE
jgi:hypothetical protein